MFGLIVNACARRLGSRAGPRTKEGGRAERVGGGWGGGGGGWGEFLRHFPVGATDKPKHGIGLQLLQGIGGGPTGRGGGWRQIKFGMGGRVGLGGRRPDPGLLVPDASRQEAEAN